MAKKDFTKVTYYLRKQDDGDYSLLRHWYQEVHGEDEPQPHEAELVRVSADECAYLEGVHNIKVANTVEDAQ